MDLMAFYGELIIIVVIPLLIYVLFPFFDLTDLNVPVINISLKTGTPKYIVFCIVLVILYTAYLKFIRNHNKERIFLTGNHYHDHPYAIYYIEAKLLGYEKCTLKMVPIPLQYKLVLNSTFNTYLSGDNLDEDENSHGYEEESHTKVQIHEFNKDCDNNMVNIVICDTYNITQQQLPIRTQNEHTIVIKRTDDFDNRKKYNLDFLHAIQTTIEKLDYKIDTVNLFCTTNPKHNLWIIQNIFSKGNRSNIQNIYISNQSNKGMRKFSDEYVKVK